jgi:hypothetical protein
MSADQEGEKGFRIVDKRGASAEKEPAQPQEPQEEERPAAGESQAGEPAEEAEAVDVYGVLRYCIALLHTHAWQSMGLVPNPVTQKIERDMEQARVAIDCLNFLVERLDPNVGPEERRSLRGLLTDLRINFARQQERSSQQDHEPQQPEE